MLEPCASEMSDAFSIVSIVRRLRDYDLAIGIVAAAYSHLSAVIGSIATARRAGM